MTREELEAMSRKRNIVQPVNLLASIPANQQTGLPATASDEGKGESQQTSKQVNPQADKPALVKFSTWLTADTIKRMKLRAVEDGTNDYEVVQAALEKYLTHDS